jgi:hypothetical protein
MSIARNTLTIVAKPLLFIMIANLASCGSILYPERHNQKAGLLDPAVVLLDGIGLLFFIIPGVIAFAVDFSNHSIYLPNKHSSGKFSQIHFNGKPDKATIEEMIAIETGLAIDLQQPNIAMFRLGSIADLDAKFALYGKNSIALAK